MSDTLKDQLIRLGAQHPDLRKDIRSILAQVSREAGRDWRSGLRAELGVVRRDYYTALAEQLRSHLGKKWGIKSITPSALHLENRREEGSGNFWLEDLDRTLAYRVDGKWFGRVEGKVGSDSPSVAAWAIVQAIEKKQG